MSLLKIFDLTEAIENWTIDWNCATWPLNSFNWLNFTWTTWYTNKWRKNWKNQCNLHICHFVICYWWILKLKYQNTLFSALFIIISFDVLFALRVTFNLMRFFGLSVDHMQSIYNLDLWLHIKCMVGGSNCECTATKHKTNVYASEMWILHKFFFSFLQSRQIL